MLNQHPAGLGQRLPFYFAAAVSLLLFGRLCIFVLKNGVNVLFNDQWDFYTPIFNGDSWWTNFTWQHASVRLGLGALLSRPLVEYTQWNSKADGMAVAALVFAATLVALVLKKKLFGNWSFFDVVIPAILLSRSFLEIYVSLPHLSLGGLSLLLVFLYCLCWLPRSPAIRHTSVLLVNFVAIYTGFTIFLGFVTPILFLREAWHSRRSSKSGAKWPLAGLAISITSLLSFFFGYRFQPGTEFNPSQYFWFIAIMFANFLGLKQPGGPALLAGMAAFLIVVVVFVWHAIKLGKGTQAESDKSLVIAILCAFSLLFTLAAAAGRSGMDLDTAQASRYLPFLACAFIALYFHLLTIDRQNLRHMAVTAYLALALANNLNFSRVDADTVYWLREGKSQWRECYLRTENIEQCNKGGTFAIHPDPQRSRLKEKLHYLKERQLNLYSSASEPWD